MLKTCLRCKESKDVSNYTKDNKRPDKLNPYCKECLKLKHKVYYAKAKDKIAERTHNWYMKNKDRKDTTARMWFLRNPEKVKAYRKVQQAKFKAKACFRDNELISRHKRRTQNKGGGEFSAEQWNQLLMDCDNKCLMCGRSPDEIDAKGRKLVPDHIMPITKASCSSYIWNIQVLCSSCNNSKGNKYVDFRPKAIRQKYWNLEVGFIPPTILQECLLNAYSI